MATITAPRVRRASLDQPEIPPLENGDHLTSAEFLRRYEAMPNLKKAELIEGRVYMPPPVSADLHAEPDGLLHLWLGTYAIHASGLKFYPNATLALDGVNTPQPDVILCSAPRPGGRVWLNDKRHLCGAPELVCEVAASSVSIDLHDKFRVYQHHGIAEYFVWIAKEKRARWFALEEQNYVELKEDSGVLKSRIFPGLALDVKALARGDARKLIATLQKHLATRR